VLHNPSSAEDVVQNVFIKLFRRPDRPDQPTAQLKSWLYRVTHNEAVDHIRRESRLRLLHDREAEEKSVRACPDGVHCTPSHEEKRALVLEHVSELKPNEQQVLLLRLEEGLSYKEIGQITGRTVGNVGKVLHHAVKKLSLRMQALAEPAT
jgi:RNA polymerase sigma-70 factor (ECF subfamily)